jgi:hypothetical protein
MFITPETLLKLLSTLVLTNILTMNPSVSLISKLNILMAPKDVTTLVMMPPTVKEKLENVPPIVIVMDKENVLTENVTEKLTMNTTVIQKNPAVTFSLPSDKLKEPSTTPVGISEDLTMLLHKTLVETTKCSEV